MKEHYVDIIETEEQVTFKGIKVKFNAIYEYCENTSEYFETEDKIRVNSLAVKDAYRKEVGLLTSSEIKRIREKYNISQKELSDVLDWGKATITRYENHQVQDRAHDIILRKVDSDPKWFLEILERSKDRISPRLYAGYYQNAYEQNLKKNNPYSYDTISVNIIFDKRSIVLDDTSCIRYKSVLDGANPCDSPFSAMSFNTKENCIFAT